MHFHQVAQVSEALIVLSLGDRAVLQERIEQLLLLTEQIDLLPTLLGHEIGGPCADLAEQRHFDALGLTLINKSQLFLHAAAFLVAVVITAPDA